MGRPSKYAPELRDRAVRMLQEHADEYSSQWAAIRSVAEKLGCATRDSSGSWEGQRCLDTC